MITSRHTDPDLQTNHHTLSLVELLALAHRPAAMANKQQMHAMYTKLPSTACWAGDYCMAKKQLRGLPFVYIRVEDLVHKSNGR